ncbi:MAG: sulfatase [Deltaproteobacteria bacterium]|nr:sulfatase [Deltaproteobacteria bacterium]
MKRRLVDLAVAAVTLGVVQALTETVVAAVLYRDFLLAPYRFFTVQSYDAFTKLWFALGDGAAVPSLLSHFLGQGVTAKLTLAPQLVAINLAVAVVLALVLTPLAGLFGIGRGGATGARERGASRGLVRALVVVAAVALTVHVAAFAFSFQPPEDRTIVKVAKALARSAIQDGALSAVAVLAVSAAGARLLLARQALRGAAIAAALALGGWPLLARVCESATALAAAERRTDDGDAGSAAAAPANGYNVILVSIDSLRADHLGAYGYPRATSPTIDALAGRGVRFGNCQSTTSWTLPAHVSLLTGRSLLGHGVVADDRRLSDSVPTLAEAFAGAGYATHAIVSAPYVNSRFGFARGFDEYDDTTVYFETNEDSYHSITAPKVQAAAASWLEGHRQRPFFLFLHYWDVHYDYAPGSGYDTMFDPDYEGSITGDNYYFDPKIRAGMNPRDLEHLVALYDGEIRLVDDHLARLRAELGRLGVADRTILVVVGDHGDEFFEHGNKGHHRTLYQEVLWVPLVIDVPGLRPATAVVEDETSIIDVAPTVLSLTGIAVPKGVEGRDLSDAFVGKPAGTRRDPQRAVFAELYRKGTLNVQVAELAARRKVIQHFNSRRLSTFDLAADPGEQRSLAPRGEVAAPMVAALREWLDGRWGLFDRRVRTEGVSAVVLDAKTAETLRSLGYLQ